MRMKARLNGPKLRDFSEWWYYCLNAQINKFILHVYPTCTCPLLFFLRMQTSQVEVSILQCGAVNDKI